MVQNHQAAAAAAKSLQLCPTLCNSIDGSPPGSPIPGILKARTLEWVCHFLLQCMKVKSESEVAHSSRSHGLQPTRLLCPWDFPGESTGMGCHCPLLNPPYFPLKSTPTISIRYVPAILNPLYHDLCVILFLSNWGP